MAFAVIMPKQGQSVESCILTELHTKKGDRVTPGDILFAYETDKATFEEEAKEPGEVLDIFFEEGDEIPVLTNVLVIGDPGEDTERFRPTASSAGVSSPEPEVEPEPQYDKPPQPQSQFYGGVAPEECAVSPRARSLAEKYGVSPTGIAGSGPGGRVIARDIISNIERTPKKTPLARTLMTRPGLQCPSRGSGLAGTIRAGDLSPAEVSGDGDVVVPLTNMRKLIAKAMFASLQNSAQLTHHMGADARRILELRARVKSGAYRVDITINDMVCYAVVRALKEFPEVNSHYLGEGIKYFGSVHLGIAVDTERGLMVPALRQADELSLEELSENLGSLARSCRKGSVNPDLLSPEAATFTVSNLGNYGVEMFTPIINLPQSAILGVNTILPRPKDIGGGVYAFVPHIGLSLTYDHRALDGGLATRFLLGVARRIENFEDVI
ncbi:MAG: 2-oxo acid dehydrogenase subunit E2 [Rikenellaceae bacterium]|nr:2-oxo acid dehydrogenase subunit E2 [Rikenellaceae bacterium]